MAFQPSSRSALAWGFAGVPIAATLIQTVLAMAGQTAEGTLLGPLAGALRSVEILDAAALTFWSSPGLVMGLFVLIAAGWLGQGAAMFALEHRDATFALAGLVSVLFFALFLGVYSPLFASGLPAGQVLLFFGTPVIAAGAVVLAALTHDWETTVVVEATGNLAEIESDLDATRTTFQREFDDRIGDLDALRAVAPTGIERAAESHKTFLDTCESLAADCEAARSSDSGEAVRRRVRDLQGRVESLDPESEAAAIERSLRAKVRSGLRTELGNVTVRSRYDRPYTLTNLPATYREVSVPAFDAEVHVDRLAEAFVSRVDDGVPLPAVADGFEQVQAHVDRTESYLAEREADLASTIESAEADLASVESAVEGFDGRVSDRLVDYALDGRHERLQGTREVEETLADARDALHDCRFDDAGHAAGEARESAAALLTLVEFLRTVEGTIDHRGRTVSIPGSIDEAVLADLGPAFESTFDAEFAVRDGRLVLDYPDADDGRESPGETRRGTPGDDPGADEQESTRPDEVVDAVLYVLRELQDAAAGAEDGRVHLQTATLPEVVARPAVLSQVASFGRRQADVVAELDVPADAPPGFVELVPADGVGPRRAASVLHERYLERYG